MRRRRTPASRWAAAATWLLALVLLERTLRAGSTGAVVLDGALTIAAAAGATKLWLHNCFESHLLVVVTVVATVAASLLSLTLGMPGGPVASLSPTHVLALALSGAVGGLLFADVRARRSDG